MTGFDYTATSRSAGYTILPADWNGVTAGLEEASAASKSAVYTVPGLDPTGVADIGPAMQAAVDSLLAQDGDTGSLSVPRGTYNLNTTVFLDGGETETSTITIDWNGSTILLGPNLYTTTAHASTTHKWGFFVNTLRTAVSAGVVTCTDGTRATGASSGQLLGLVMEDAFFDSQGSARGIAFFDRSPIVMRCVGYSGSCGVSGRDYTDTMEFDHCNLRGSGSLFYWQTGQGDGLVITTPNATADALVVGATTNP